MEKKLYSMAPRGRQWAIIHWNYTSTGSTGTVYSLFQSKEQALDELKKLKRKR